MNGNMNAETAMLQTPAPHTVPGVAPLIWRLVEQFGALWLDGAGQADEAALRDIEGDCVLFLGGDPVRFPECLDVAVVLPELQRHVGGAFRIAVASPAGENAWGNRYGCNRRPALIFLRDGQYVSTLAGMHDWPDYVAAVEQALAAPVSRAPGIGIAVVAAGASMSGSGCG